MVVYLSNPYGTIPGENWREYRFFLLAKSLAAAGHEVVWFTSTFSHHFKKQRSDVSKAIQVQPNLRIHLIRSTAYERNLSWGRVRRDLVYGRNLRKVLGKEYSVPDLFIIGDSPILFYFPSYWYARRFRVKYVVDQMDLWPELIVQAMPRAVRPLAELLCAPIYWVRRRVYAGSAGFISLAQRYLDIPMKICPAMLHRPHAVIYNGIDTDEFREHMRRPAANIDAMVGQKQPGERWLIFAGTLGPSYDVAVMLKGFTALGLPNCRLLIAGDGSERGFVEQFIHEHPKVNIRYLGNINKQDLPYLYGRCDVGLNAYGAYSNVEMSDKFYDYTAAGLAVINSLKGEVADLISKFDLGMNYQGGDTDSFVAALKGMLGDGGRLAIMQSNAYKLGTDFDQKLQLQHFVAFASKVLHAG